ncbi:MAG: hypothetical protein IPH22_12550 [Nitrosomonas sp.]|nr:hypothetical protein [Nitrosomonas sp.]
MPKLAKIKRIALDENIPRQGVGLFNDSSGSSTWAVIFVGMKRCRCTDSVFWKRLK